MDRARNTVKLKLVWLGDCMDVYRRVYHHGH